MENPAPLVAIVGPTGSGKSDLAVELARRIPGEVINCDSVQVYQYFDVGTAKLTAKEQRGVPHHLLDYLVPDQPFTAGDFARAARALAAGITTAGRLPIVAGGTGFYLRALTDGLPPAPESDEALRRNLLDRESRRPGLLHRALRVLDPPSAARIHPNDTRKLTRAVEVCLLARRPLSQLGSAPREPLAGFRTLKIALDPPREELYRRLDARVERMFQSGLIEETRGILDRGYARTCKPFESLGYRQAVGVIAGEISVEEAIERTRRDTRRYAKRQWTWFRREPGVEWIRGFGGEPAVAEAVAARVARFVDGG